MADAIFGGSFDPIHVGHLHIAEHARHALALERVLFVPARRNPLKERGPVASDGDRREMIVRAIAGNGAFALEPWELDHPAPSYTVDTVDALLSGGRIQAEPYLIVGDELVDELPRWRSLERLLSLVRLVVVTRTAEPHARSPLPPDAVLLSNVTVAVSSSAIRDRLRSGGSVRYLVPDAVYDYIEDRGLYR